MFDIKSFPPEFYIRLDQPDERLIPENQFYSRIGNYFDERRTAPHRLEQRPFLKQNKKITKTSRNRFQADVVTFVHSRNRKQWLRRIAGTHTPANVSETA